jgi:S1-C subfamily serine protease
MESVSGITLSLGSAVVIVWLIAAGIGSLPFVGFSNSVNNANIIQFLDSHLPAAPSVFEVFSKMVDPNTPPQIFTKAIPNSSIGSTVIPSATTKDEIQAGQSVVRITSFGCGGIVDGSGFVVAPDLIATSAHVIAGVQKPTIKYGSHSISATPVVFDPNLDFAVLRVNGLHIRPLPLYSASITSGAPVDVIGYPGSIFTVSPGVVQKSQQISGTNLYGLGTIVRNVYIVRASVKKGNSGGPVVTSNGYVIGIIFARLKTNGQYAYALTASSISAEVNQAKKISGHIGTGVCFTGN